MKYSIILAAALATMGGLAMAEENGAGGDLPSTDGCEGGAASCEIGAGEHAGGEQPGEDGGAHGGDEDGGEGGGEGGDA